VVCEEEDRADLMNDRPIFSVVPTAPVNPDTFIDSTTTALGFNDMVEITVSTSSFFLLNLKYVSTVNTRVRIDFLNNFRAPVVADVS